MQDSHHILLVEDNPHVRRATYSFLTSQGYKVTAVGTLTAAIDCTRSSPDLDLLITDYHLPDGATGKQVVGSVREVLGPQFRALVITGDTASAVHQFDGDRALCWLRKPVDPELLLASVRNLLA